MKRNFIGVVAVGMLLGWALQAHGQYAAVQPALPSPSGPQLQYVHLFDAANESLQLDDIRVVTDSLMGPETDPATGGIRFTTKEDTRQIIERRTYRLADLRGLSPKGEALKLADVLARVKPDHPVLVVAKGQKLSADYQKLLRDDVIILELPAGPHRPQPPGGFPVPVATPVFIPSPAAPPVPSDVRPRLTAPPSLPFTPAPSPDGDSRF